MSVTQHPRTEPVLALLTHTVPTSNLGEKAGFRVWMEHLNLREKDSQPLQKTLPSPVAPLTTPLDLAEPESKHLITERSHLLLIARNRVILKVAPHHGLQPLRCFGDRLVHSLAQLLLNVLQLGCHPFADRLSFHDEVPCPATLPSLRSAASPKLCRRSTPRCRSSGPYSSSPSPNGPCLTAHGQPRGLSVLARQVSMPAWGLRLRRAA